MSDIAELVLDSLRVMRKSYDNTSDLELKRRIQDAYFKVVDVSYKDDITKVLAYKRLWYSAKL